MPTYDYKCTKCGYTFELFQTMSADPVKECPNCGGIVKRLIGPGSGPIFKGTGFYQTDYKNNKPVKKDSPSKGASPDKK
jgi:putative FmdB family regulatory protein